MSAELPDSDDPIDPAASDAVTSPGEGDVRDLAETEEVEASPETDALEPDAPTPRSEDVVDRRAASGAGSAADSWPFLQTDERASTAEDLGALGGLEDVDATDDADVALDAVFATGPDAPANSPPIAAALGESGRESGGAPLSSPAATTEEAAAEIPPPSAGPERPSWITRIKTGLSPNAGSMRRVAVRSLLVGLAAMAVGFGYGASVRLFFGDSDRELSPNSPNPATSSNAGGGRDPGTPGSSASDAAVAEQGAHVDGSGTGASTLTPGTAGAAGIDDRSPGAAGSSGAASEHGSIAAARDAASHGGRAPGSDAARGETDPSSSALPKATFTMPSLGSALPREQHPLAVARERLQRGDLEAARRVAASYLLREDGLGHEDQLFVAQAYALLADSLRVEWERGLAVAKDESSRAKPASEVGAQGEDRRHDESPTAPPPVESPFGDHP